MADNKKNEAWLSVKEVMQRENIARSTVYNRRIRGVLNRWTREQIYLQYRQNGGTIEVSESAIREFHEHLNRRQPADAK